MTITKSPLRYPGGKSRAIQQMKSLLLLFNVGYTELKARAYDVGILLDEMQAVGNPVNIVILDACRNNPFRRFRGGARGLTSMNGPKGSLIAFATAPNSVAQDGTGRNGKRLHRK